MNRRSLLTGGLTAGATMLTLTSNAQSEEINSTPPAESGRVPDITDRVANDRRRNDERTMLGRSAPVSLNYGGTDLTGWTTVVGDGIHQNDGEAPVNLTDINTSNHGSHSTLHANTASRGVMAHNITYKPMVDDACFDYVHEASFQFRVPSLPTTSSTHRNAQTFEGGLFIWDGAWSRRDYGQAVQWVLNPWDDEFGCVKRWSNEPHTWVPVFRLEPDTAWHQLDFRIDPLRNTAELRFDRELVDAEYTVRTKPETWGTEIAARLQAEIISLDPGANPAAPPQEAEVKNWNWKRRPLN